uniref:Uncharacterized protein n=1 Tax=viral metagenome TaxID=1070528 RepID=A0A6M3M0R8_9ZZZZ
MSNKNPTKKFTSETARAASLKQKGKPKISLKRALMRVLASGKVDVDELALDMINIARNKKDTSMYKLISQTIDGLPTQRIEQKNIEPVSKIEIEVINAKTAKEGT